MSTQEPSPGFGRQPKGEVASDWDICGVCERAMTLVGKERVIRAHGHPARRCPGGGLTGIYLNDRNKHR